jgi:hypothetical protein
VVGLLPSCSIPSSPATIRGKKVPFKSEKQRKYLFANEPQVAKKWAKETPKGKKLPEKVAKPRPKK